MRRAAYDARNAQTDKDQLSQMAVASLMRLPEYQAAKAKRNGAAVAEIVAVEGVE